MASFRTLHQPIVRSFCTTATRNDLVKTPIQVFGLEGRYASALYSAASKQKQLDAVEKDFQKIVKSFNTDKVFREFLLSPIQPKALKATAIEQIASKLSLASSSKNLLGLLAENGKLKLFPAIANAFQSMMAASRGDVNVEVTCASELDSSIKQELESTLQKFAKKGENLIIKYKLDPSIIGGLVVSIGDKFVDLSTANKLKRYTGALKSTV